MARRQHHIGMSVPSARNKIWNTECQQAHKHDNNGNGKTLLSLGLHNYKFLLINATKAGVAKPPMKLSHKTPAPVWVNGQRFTRGPICLANRVDCHAAVQLRHELIFVIC